MRNLIISVGIVMSSILLTACGGEGGDGDSSGGGGGLGYTSISSDSYVAGSFKDANATNFNHLLYPNQTDLGWECAQNSDGRYFESDRVIVVGEGGMSDDDYRWGATLGERSLDRALAAVGLSYEQYLSLKPGVSTEIAGRITTMLTGIDYANEYTGDPELSIDLYDDEVLDRYFDGATRSGLYDAQPVSDWRDISTYIVGNELPGGAWAIRLFEVELQRMTHQEQADLYADLKAEFDTNGAYTDATPADVFDSIEKVVVCLSSSRSNSEWGMGTKTGFEVAAKSATQRSDDLTIGTHEVIHHLQITITAPLDGDIALERWYSEGQAVKLSGMTVTSDKGHGRQTLDVIGFPESGTVYGFANPNEYPDYGQAYNWFLGKFGQNEGIGFLFDIRNNSEHPHGYTFGHKSFVESLNALTPVSCTYDCGYELSDYRLDYSTQLQNL
ncbi:hypothetical protein SNR37_002263 [Agarivorans aestuarii]|uniref:Uncharacterized protein n=1 Tax=Agarivorans aestuarii TaxID=1563703 RepID=A0ABU7G0C1_9ALTE|nr:hypothetical protein [Agarivorans aestuarii]MEE1672852.1 hypothetical protein [Agarivorans aestuarii]